METLVGSRLLLCALAVRLDLGRLAPSALRRPAELDRIRTVAAGDDELPVDEHQRTRGVTPPRPSTLISDAFRSNWVADREPPKLKLATVKAHQSNRRRVQKLISETLQHQNKRPIWNGTPYQTRITGFTLTAAGE